ncbi:MAG: twin-arginine translocase subunit TatC [Candidatus Bipolaricaulota bacterium]|nr:twin-arginine translocase subunit TatC [Candidatus Bipolaricaulota bacterium]MCS7274744.1 twin-arginine translocase subunit TatC [Candidatus Bipolaricaulota bacterium]MDW8110023.1 twin-arginine translocase subunit TatC [Candidatus Bipolaricaulota bacterium]MDW8328905.1 twin-arginine translocase subunit TatC [Candidatus Bipolaricaulota bacterium]
MSLWEHLDELRARVIYSLVVVLAIAIVAYIFREQLLAFLTAPLRALTGSRAELLRLLESCRTLLLDPHLPQMPEERWSQLAFECRSFLFQGGSLIFIRPTEVFFGYIKLALSVGLLVGAPFILYQIWQFIVPALFPHEKKYARYGFTAGAGLFYLGAFGCLFFVVPAAIRFFVGLGGPYLQATFTFDHYISFILWMMLGFGLAFELPMVLFLLAKIGLVTHTFLRENRKYAIVLAFVLGAFLTPTPDPFTQTAMALPLIILYEATLWAIKWTERKRATEIATEN